MEAGKVKWHGEYRMVDLIDAMIEAADEELRCRRQRHGALGLPDLRLVLGHVYRQFDELPDRGAGPLACRATAPSSPPTPTARSCSCKAGQQVVELCRTLVRQRRRLGAAALDRQLCRLSKMP
jgi:hypothetical protein